MASIRSTLMPRARIIAWWRAVHVSGQACPG